MKIVDNSVPSERVWMISPRTAFSGLSVIFPDSSSMMICSFATFGSSTGSVMPLV